jgi:hypothetical protein
LFRVHDRWGIRKTWGFAGVCVDADAPHVIVLGVLHKAHLACAGHCCLPFWGYELHTRTWEALVLRPTPSRTAPSRESKTLISALWMRGA